MEGLASPPKFWGNALELKDQGTLIEQSLTVIEQPLFKAISSYMYSCNNTVQQSSITISELQNFKFPWDHVPCIFPFLHYQDLHYSSVCIIVHEIMPFLSTKIVHSRYSVLSATVYFSPTAILDNVHSKQEYQLEVKIQSTFSIQSIILCIKGLAY